MLADFKKELSSANFGTFIDVWRREGVEFVQRDRLKELGARSESAPVLVFGLRGVISIAVTRSYNL